MQEQRLNSLVKHLTQAGIIDNSHNPDQETLSRFLKIFRNIESFDPN